MLKLPVYCPGRRHLDIWTSYTMVSEGNEIMTDNSVKGEMNGMHKMEMHLCETYMPLLSLWTSRVLGSSSVDSTSIMNASYALQGMQSTQSYKVITSCLQFLSLSNSFRFEGCCHREYIYSQGAAKATRWSDCHAWYLTPHSIILAQGGQEKNTGQINFLSLTPSNQPAWRCPMWPSVDTYQTTELSLYSLLWRSNGSSKLYLFFFSFRIV